MMKRHADTYNHGQGISLKAEQFAALVQLLPQLEAALAEKRFILPRPSYDRKPTVDGDEEMAEGNDDNKDKEGKAEDDQNEAENLYDSASRKKKNFEATSDEEE